MSDTLNLSEGPPVVRWTLWAGNDQPILVEMTGQTGSDGLAGSRITMMVKAPNGEEVLFLDSAVDPEIEILDQEDPDTIWKFVIALTIEQRRAMVGRRHLVAEVKWHMAYGGQRTYWSGPISVIEGADDNVR